MTLDLAAIKARAEEQLAVTPSHVFARDVLALVRALEQRPVVTEEWRDIATAPKDGTEIIVYAPNNFVSAGEHVFTARWQRNFGVHGDTWVCAAFNQPWNVQPTDWRPLPLPPR